MSLPVIRLQGVSKSYGTGAGKQQVLYDVSLEIEAGHLISIVGTSGSGKSTLLNIVGGLDRGYTGEVEVLGVPYHTSNDRRLAALRNTEIGFVFQAFNLLDHLTCWENVCLPSFFGRSTSDAFARAVAQLQRVGLDDKVQAKPANMSGGQKQRVAIARALFNRPKLLLCDEPTGNLDSRTGAQILDLFYQLNHQDGITVVVVTHEPRVSSTADRVIRLEDGRVCSDERITAEAAAEARSIVQAEGCAHAEGIPAPPGAGPTPGQPASAGVAG
jgi:putative ABC transport system ATP-binding protein